MTKTEIYNSTFQFNSALEGGVFCAKDVSEIICTNCLISHNFAVIGGMFIVNTQGRLIFRNSTIKDNKAISAGIGEILDSIKPTKIESSNLTSNLLVSKEYLQLQVCNCSDLCFIPKDYISHYFEYAKDLHEINKVQFKI